MKALFDISHQINGASSVVLESYLRLQEGLGRAQIHPDKLRHSLNQTYCMLYPDAPSEDLARLYYMLDHPDINEIQPALRDVFARAERRLEMLSGKEIAGHRDVHEQDVAAGLFDKNFFHLTEIEEALLRTRGFGGHGANTRVAFVGMSALPFSPLVLNRTFSLQIDCIDYDDESIEVGQTLARKMGLQDQIHFMAKAPQTHDYKGYAVVIIAARAQPKDKIITKITQSPTVEFLVMRTVNDPATLFYDRLKQGVLTHQGFLLRHVTRPMPPFFQASHLYENMGLRPRRDKEKPLYVPWRLTDTLYNDWFRPGGVGWGGGWNKFTYSKHLNSTHFGSYVETKGASRYRVQEGKVYTVNRGR